MLSDKLQAKQEFTDKRGAFEKAYQRFAHGMGSHMSKDGLATMASELNTLLTLHAELVQAPVLYTLRSAAEVGFAQAQITPKDEGPTPEEADERARDIRSRMGGE